MVYKSALDVEGLKLHYPCFGEILIEKGWDIALLTLNEPLGAIDQGFSLLYELNKSRLHPS